jgi:hypothetical protein
LQYCTSGMTDMRVFSVRFMKMYEPIRLEASFLVHMPQYVLVLAKQPAEVVWLNSRWGRHRANERKCSLSPEGNKLCAISYSTVPGWVFVGGMQVGYLCKGATTCYRMHLDNLQGDPFMLQNECRYFPSCYRMHAGYFCKVIHSCYRIHVGYLWKVRPSCYRLNAGYLWKVCP